MEFEWDESKRLRNIRNHGVDFAYAALIFRGMCISKLDDREDYGEEREITLGSVDGNIIVVVHTERDGVIRIISAWKGSKRDHDSYYESISG